LKSLQEQRNELHQELREESAPGFPERKRIR
jgi:hypothetical protein